MPDRCETVDPRGAEARVAELARLVFDATSEPARVAAIKELLDRGYSWPKSMAVSTDARGFSLTLRWEHPRPVSG